MNSCLIKWFPSNSLFWWWLWQQKRHQTLPWHLLYCHCSAAKHSEVCLSRGVTQPSRVAIATVANLIIMKGYTRIDMQCYLSRFPKVFTGFPRRVCKNNCKKSAQKEPTHQTNGSCVSKPRIQQKQINLNDSRNSEWIQLKLHSTLHSRLGSALLFHLHGSYRFCFKLRVALVFCFNQIPPTSLPAPLSLSTCWQISHHHFLLVSMVTMTGFPAQCEASVRCCSTGEEVGWRELCALSAWWQNVISLNNDR